MEGQTQVRTITVPKPAFVLGDTEPGSTMRAIYGPEEEGGRRPVVGTIDSASTHFGKLWAAIGKIKVRPPKR